ncbi:hypothetical protein [Bradyrhizobium sp. HKCCYLS2038]
MLSALFWKFAASDFALTLDLSGLLASAGVGYLPMVRFLPIVGPYVQAARVGALVLALVVAFVFGFRGSDERDAVLILRDTLALRTRELDAAKKAAEDAKRRADEIEAAATSQRQSDADYIGSLQAKPACALGDDDLRNLRGVRVNSK